MTSSVRYSYEKFFLANSRTPSGDICILDHSISSPRFISETSYERISSFHFIQFSSFIYHGQVGFFFSLSLFRNHSFSMEFRSDSEVVFEEVFSADQIDDHIWLGDIDSSGNESALNALNITHILTVLHYDPDRPKNDRRTRKHVYAYDFHTTDLIGEFESCYRFIEQAVEKNENVLIHCHAGKSNEINTSMNQSFLFPH